MARLTSSARPYHDGTPDHVLAYRTTSPQAASARRDAAPPPGARWRPAPRSSLIAGLLAMGGWRPPAAAAASQSASVPANAVVVAPHDLCRMATPLSRRSAPTGRIPRSSICRAPLWPVSHRRPRGAGCAHRASRSCGLTAIRRPRRVESAAALGALNSLADGTAAAAAGGRTSWAAGLPSLGPDLKLPNAEGAAGATQAAVSKLRPSPAVWPRCPARPSRPRSRPARSRSASSSRRSAATQAGETSESWATDSGGYGSPIPSTQAHRPRGLYRRQGLNDPGLVGKPQPGGRPDLRHPRGGKAGRAGGRWPSRAPRVNGATVDEAHRRVVARRSGPGGTRHEVARLLQETRPTDTRRPRRLTTMRCAAPTAPTGPFTVVLRRQLEDEQRRVPRRRLCLHVRPVRSVHGHHLEQRQLRTGPLRRRARPRDRSTCSARSTSMRHRRPATQHRRISTRGICGSGTPTRSRAAPQMTPHHARRQRGHRRLQDRAVPR